MGIHQASIGRRQPVEAEARRIETATCELSARFGPPHVPDDRAVRIFVACHGTQLLVILHMRKHLALPPAREYLLWYPLENSAFIDGFMQELLSNADFDATLDIRDFHSLTPRAHGAAAWWLESVRRLRRDAARVRTWLAANRISPEHVELWADDPIHVYVRMLRGMFCASRQVKFPHCFNQEDATIPAWKARVEAQWRRISPLKRHAFLPWQRWASGVDLRMERVVYDRAYTFDAPSPWSPDSRDVSHLISLAAFDATYRGLPVSLHQEIETILAPIRSGRRPLVLLLLFGLNAALREAYQAAVTRMFCERAVELAGCAFAVKVHPGTYGEEEDRFFDWLGDNIPAPVHPIIHPLNLEFMLPQLRPDYVLAGPCGALPVVARLGAARVVALAEVTDEMCRVLPTETSAFRSLVQSMEVW
jgi:hypothetical protein